MFLIFFYYFFSLVGLGTKGLCRLWRGSGKNTTDLKSFHLHLSKSLDWTGPRRMAAFLACEEVLANKSATHGIKRQEQNPVLTSASRCWRPLKEINLSRFRTEGFMSIWIGSWWDLTINGAQLINNMSLFALVAV